MTTQQDSPRLPDVKFRVLIIGRANAGKTTILQRVCDTTESPEIYRLGKRGKRYQVKLDPTIERGQHKIDDELIFTNHTGYIFHDSRGFEGGSKDELKIVQEFVKRKSQEKRLNDRLHVIWYCTPMDNDRPSLDLRHFDAICPDKNVPVIAVFTKFDQFKRDTKMKLEDQGRDQIDLNTEVENEFNQHYLAELNGPPPFIRLEKMQKHGESCAGLIELTADALSDDVVALMLLAVQKDNLELKIKQAIKWTHRVLEQRFGSAEQVIKRCTIAFPSLWFVTKKSFEECEENWFSENLEESAEKKAKFFKFEDKELFFENGKILISKLLSLNSNSHLRISSNDRHHTMIVTVLILDHAAVLYASPSRPTLGNAVDQAYSQYRSSGAHNAIKERFPLPRTQYSISEFTEFVLNHRLQ